MSDGTCRVCGAPASDGTCILCGSTKIEGRTDSSAPSAMPAPTPGSTVGWAPSGPPPSIPAATVATSRGSKSRAPVVIIGSLAAVAIVGIVGANLTGQRPQQQSRPGGGNVNAQPSIAAPSGEPAKPSTAAPSGAALRTVSPGTWITVLDSLAKSEVTEADAAARAVAFGSGVVVVDSDAVGGLNSGYWALALVGLPTRDAARAACARVARDVGPTCYPRAVS